MLPAGFFSSHSPRFFSLRHSLQFGGVIVLKSLTVHGIIPVRVNDVLSVDVKRSDIT